MAHKYRHVDHVGSKLCYWNGRLTMSVYIYVYFYSISRFILVMKNGHKTYMMSSIDVIKLIGFSYEHAEHCTVLPCAMAGDGASMIQASDCCVKKNTGMEQAQALRRTHHKEF